MRARVAELEARVAMLEGKSGARRGPEPTQCPLCRGALVVIEEKPHAMPGLIGLKTHAMKCEDCSMTVERDFDVAKGYI